MRKTSAFGLWLVMLSLLFSAGSMRAERSRLAATVGDDGEVALRDTVAPRARLAADLGPAPADLRIETMTLRFKMTAAQQGALNQLLVDQQNPASPRYRQWLTPEQYAVRFGLGAGDLRTVAAWLAGQGLTVKGTARSGTFITFGGSVAQVERAFGTRLHRLSLDGEEHVANLTDPVLPAGIASVVVGMTGLHDFQLKPRAQGRSVKPTVELDGKLNPKFTSSVSGNHFIAPDDFYTIYDVAPLLANTIRGTGITIGVMGQTDISLADVAAFRAASGLSASAPVIKLYGADPGTRAPDLDEAQLDVEWSGAVAPGATILFVTSTDVVGTSLTQAIDNNLAPILTISYGDCEAGFGPSALNLFNQLFQQANAQGITVLGPTGDSGATDCDYHAKSAVQGLAVDFPASSPFVTAVGGTMFNEGGGTYFSATNNANMGSAISYIPEAVWNEAGSRGFASGGGGVSMFFTKPAWQVGNGVPRDFSRDLPDLSLNAASGHDGYLFCSKGSCVNGYRSAAGNLAVVGGTSVSTPAFAGLLALVEQKITARVGNANPVIYGLANSSFYNNVFHDVVTGNNSTPCTVGTPDCLSGGPIGYSAAPGYDLATGWGTIDAFNMVNHWAAATPTGLGSTTGNALSATVLTGDPTPVAAGATLKLAIRTAAASSGAAAVPTGTAQILIDNKVSGIAVALPGGVGTASIPTAGLSSGAHTVTAAYSGDAVYAGSKGLLTIDIVSTSAPDFFLTPAGAISTVTSGGTAPGIVYTVHPVNGFVGSVTFTATTDTTTLAVTPMFSVNPVVISGTSDGTTTLTLQAFTTTRAPITAGRNDPAIGSRVAAALSGMSLAALLFFALPGRRRRLPGLAAVLVCVLGGIGLSGCSGTPNATPPPPPGNGGVITTKAAPGTYNIAVTALTGTPVGAATPTGAIAHVARIELVIQ